MAKAHQHSGQWLVLVGLASTAHTIASQQMPKVNSCVMHVGSARRRSNEPRTMPSTRDLRLLNLTHGKILLCELRANDVIDLSLAFVDNLGPWTDNVVQPGSACDL